MERSVKEITLPITGFKVNVYDYYLRGDRVAIERIMTDAVEMTGDGKVASVKTSYRYDMEDEAVLRAVKSVKDGEKEVTVDKDFVHALPEEDYEFLVTNLPKENVKKSTSKPSSDISEKPQKSGE
jgi:hypothetical protein